MPSSDSELERSARRVYPTPARSCATGLDRGVENPAETAEFPKNPAGTAEFPKNPAETAEFRKRDTECLFSPPAISRAAR
jgi:hypothetical protein